MRGWSSVRLVCSYRSLKEAAKLTVIRRPVGSEAKVCSVSIHLCICFTWSCVLNVPVNGGVIHFWKCTCLQGKHIVLIMQVTISTTTKKIWKRVTHPGQSKTGMWRISWRGKWWQRSNEDPDDSRGGAGKRDNTRKVSSGWREWRGIWASWWRPRWRLVRTVMGWVRENSADAN